MPIVNILFYITAALAVLATILVITRANAVHSLLYLIISLLAVAVIFFLLGAPFVAVLEVIIYAGAIMVLFVFVIMMLNLGRQAERQKSIVCGTENLGRAGSHRAAAAREIGHDAGALRPREHVRRA